MDHSPDAELRTLRDLLLETREVITMDGVPAHVAARGSELLTAAVSLADDLLQTKPAAALGKRGGSQTAKRGPEYFSKIAGMRKTNAGGRPRKAPTSPE